MSLGSLIMPAAACTLFLDVIRRKSEKSERQKIVAEIVHALSYAFLTATWIGRFFEREEMKIVSIIMVVLSGLVTLMKVLAFIARIILYNQHKQVRKAETLISRLRKMHDKCEIECSLYVGVNDVIISITEFCKKDIKDSQLVPSAKDILSVYLPEYVKVYIKYADTIHEYKFEIDSLKLISKAMEECSKKFLQRIEEAKEEQEEFDKNNREQKLITKGSDFEATAEAFGAMIELPNNLSMQYDKDDTDNLKLAKKIQN